ncbi:MAG: tripartite tricarboxylate transporter permease [Candidatus Diapherotrites archaeon]|nr:tripartite tricarboxylate transporter permease [Candidatus Diapherotrites archaeon]
MNELIQTLIGFGGGMIAGIISGLAPGIHSNHIAMLASAWNEATPFALAAFIVSATTANQVFDLIPSIFLGAPEKDQGYTTLAGHRMLLQGRASQAILIAAGGGLAGGISALALAPLLGLILPFIHATLRPFIPFILGTLLLALIFGAEKNTRNASLLCTLLGTLLGLAALPRFGELVFPIISGLFGASNSLQTMLAGTRKIPSQTFAREIPWKTSLPWGILGAGMAALTSPLPAISASFSSLFLEHTTRMKDRKFLALNAGINSATGIYALAVLWSIGKTRTGSTVAIEQILSIDAFSFMALVLLSGTALILATLLVVVFQKKILHGLTRIPYIPLNAFMLIVLGTASILYAGTLGLLSFTTATLLGYYTLQSGAKKSTQMAFLIVPTILIYL